MTAVFEVDLAALGSNLRRIREEVAPAEHLLVVKDDAYGHGLARIVQAARAEGITWFGTFDVATALEVRRVAGAEARVLAWTVYHGDDIDAALSAGLDLGLGTRELIAQVSRRAAERGLTARVHLKIDTGLRRNGILPEEWPQAVQEARSAQERGMLRIAGVWSHIAEASDEEDDRAREAFLVAAAALDAPGALRHLAASAASFARPEFRFDLVRIGAFAYGIRPAGGPGDEELGIRPIGTLLAPVTAVGADRVTLGVGSLDGLDSRLAGRLEVVTEAGPRRVLSITQTETAVEVWDGAAAGQEIPVLGERAVLTATDAAEILGTVGEEVVLRFSPRLPRRYVAGGQAPGRSS